MPQIVINNPSKPSLRITAPEQRNISIGKNNAGGGCSCNHTIEDDLSISKLILTIGSGTSAKRYAIDREEIVKPDAPTITAGADFYNSKTITMSAATGATIRYAMTTDGSAPVTPTASTGTQYSSAVTIGSTSAYQTTYKIVAVAIKNGMVSDPTTVQTYTCTRRVAAPEIAIGGNKYASSREITLTAHQADAIMYRIGSTGSYSLYNSSLKPTITTNGDILYAYAIKYGQTIQDGWADSEVVNSGAVTIGAKKCYIGQAASLADNAAVEALANSYERDTLVGYTAPTIDFGSTTEYVWFAIPNTAARNLTVKSSGYGVTLNDAAGSIVGSYRVWRTANKINSSFTFEIS